jgi:hypothetical protein
MNAFSKIGTTVIAGLMLLVGAGNAGAHELLSAEAAQTKADSARARAAQLARQGGWAYKTGAVDRALTEANRYQAQADAVRGVAAPAAQTAVSPALAEAQARLDELRKAGGWAYKSGAIARAEADVRALTAPQPVTMGLNERVQKPNWGKPVERTLRTYR